MDLDEVNRNLLKNGSIVYETVKEHFPDAFDEELNKKKLAAIIFSDSERKKELEDILHPTIKEIMLSEMDKHDPFFCEVPLLFESGFDRFFDESWLIVCDEETSIERLVEKGYTRSEAEERINAQMSKEEKEKRASKIIYNKSTFADFISEIDKLLKGLC